MSNTPSAKKVVLIADDDALVRQLTRNVLDKAGYDVREASTGYEAAEALAQGGIDVILADINMPGNENFELLRQEATAHSLVPVIIVTGYPSMESAIDALRLGVVDYITKPLVFDVLIERIEQAISKGRALRALRDAEDRIASLAAWLDDLKSSILRPATSLRPSSRPPASHVLRPAGDIKGMTDASERAALSGLSDEEYAKLSPREREVVGSLALGHHVQEMATLLDVSTNTVRNHLKSVFLKLGVNSQIQLLAKVSGRRNDR